MRGQMIGRFRGEVKLVMDIPVDQFPFHALCVKRFHVVRKTIRQMPQIETADHWLQRWGRMQAFLHEPLVLILIGIALRLGEKALDAPVPAGERDCHAAAEFRADPRDILPADVIGMRPGTLDDLRERAETECLGGKQLCEILSEKLPDRVQQQRKGVRPELLRLRELSGLRFQRILKVRSRFDHRPIGLNEFVKLRLIRYDRIRMVLILLIVEVCFANQLSQRGQKARVALLKRLRGKDVFLRQDILIGLQAGPDLCLSGVRHLVPSSFAALGGGRK